MKTIIINRIDEIQPIENLTLCLGFFDALHLGHLALLKKANELGGNVGVLTFSKNPKELLTSQKCSIINTLEMKQDILEKYNVSHLLILDLSWNILNLTKEEFINDILLKLKVKNIVCGFDYSFGKKGEGKAVDLIKSNLFKVAVIDEIKNEKEQKISSTLIHGLIRNGDVEEANRYLTRYYKVLGKVEHGYQIGRKIEFNTANISLNDNFEIPSNGVYATLIKIDGIDYPSMTNVGIHPTINCLNNIAIETYIFDFHQNIYQKNVELSFLKKTRDEKKFESLDELKSQLKKDQEQIKKYFNEIKIVE